MTYLDLTDNTEQECDRGPEGCSGEVFARTSRSGLTRSWICEQHADQLERSLDAVAERYPEVNHPEYCMCPGCRDAW
jgi:hypothetical protein